MTLVIIIAEVAEKESFICNDSCWEVLLQEELQTNSRSTFMAASLKERDSASLDSQAEHHWAFLIYILALPCQSGLADWVLIQTGYSPAAM